MANLKEHELVYPLQDQLPALGQTLEVAPGVRWLRMNLPFALDHINLWLLRDRQDGREGWTVVDCGISNSETRAAWKNIFANDMEGLPVLRVIVTHMHPDHMGLASWLTEKYGCELWISATDFAMARIASLSTIGQGGDSAAAFFASHGLTDPEAQDQLRTRTSYYPSMVPKVPHQYRRLMDGLALNIGGHQWNCIVGYGHSFEHIALHCPETRVMLSGDMVLPRISTNVSVYEVEPIANPLHLYLTSIRRLRTLAADTLVLPAHGKPFTGLHARIDQLCEHHDDRLAEVMEACAREPQHAAGLLDVMFKRKLDLHQTTFAMGEAVAHLHLLWLEGKLKLEVGQDGVRRFALA